MLILDGIQLKARGIELVRTKSGVELHFKDRREIDFEALSTALAAQGFHRADIESAIDGLIHADMWRTVRLATE